MLKAKKITKPTAQSQQLATFVASLGIPNTLDLYSCNGLIYLNINSILPILSVDEKWFLKNAESPLHYIRVNKTIHINRYGMTKLIGQSKQPAALKLQDYLYDLFYQAETNGFVDITKLKSRDEFLMLTNELKLCQTINATNQLSMAEAEDNNKILRADIATLTQENAALSLEKSRLEDELKIANEELSTYSAMANNLARYVRAKSRDPPAIAYSDMLDTEDPESYDSISELKLVQDAINAKNFLKSGKPKSAIIPRSQPTLQELPSHTYYLMRSVEPIDTDAYHWTLTDVAPSDQQLDFTERTLLSDELSPHLFKTICYQTLRLSNDKKNAIILFLSLSNGIYDEITIQKLIS